MNEIDNYLAQHYWTDAKLAAACSVVPEEIATLIEQKLIPQPSYVVTDDGALVSKVFGRFEAAGSVPGRYFHPASSVWVALAVKVRSKVGPLQAHVELASRFKHNFAAALSELNESTFRHSDSFSNTGERIPEGLNTRIESAWEAFLGGIYGLCVVDPSTERSIARKEVLQEVIVELTENGSKRKYSPSSKVRVMELIDQYSSAAIPFSPPEYPNSSRRRLVDDLKKIIVLG